ncbi:MAG TPA: lysylphosphatidylglycerol synthase transmembrane domain-containing protein [Thermoguttaceae bacterium]|nr:lysylphosphatidylglycerol synthase transmembrane domain-containing protein [Thermoguttaceae bacterium]
MKKLIVTTLKIGISLAIVAWLAWDAAGTTNESGENVFQQLVHQPKNWGLLAAAWVFCASAVTLTLIRWWYLVRALDLPFRLTEGLRIGFLGYLFNLAPMGIVGGDVLKAVMLAREYDARQRVRAVAAVVIDRLIGLYTLFVVATAAILLTGLHRLRIAEIQVICNATFLLTALGAAAIAVLMIPGFTDGRGTRALGRLPKIGQPIEHLIEAVRMYRRQPLVLTVSVLMSVGVHSLFATGVYLIARGLFGEVLSLRTHFVVSPLSASTGVLPLPVGPFELVLESLYGTIAAYAPEPGVIVAAGTGLVVALGYRLICVLIAAIGVCYYLSGRREIAEAMQQVEEEQPLQGLSVH